MTTQRKHRKSKAKMYSHCKVCGKAKQIPKHLAKDGTKPKAKSTSTKPSAYVDPRIYMEDPYCSTACCKRDHGVPVSTSGPAHT